MTRSLLLSGNLQLIVVAAFAILWVIKRCIYNPSLTDDALGEYTQWLILNLSYEELITRRWEVFEFHGRRPRAHTDIFTIQKIPGMVVVEVDVHPSLQGVLTISQSSQIILRDRTSLEKLRRLAGWSSEESPPDELLNVLEVSESERELIQEALRGVPDDMAG